LSKNVDTPEKNPNWERQLLEKITLESLKELRAKRRWGIFFKLAGLAYLVMVSLATIGALRETEDKAHAPIIGNYRRGGDAVGRNNGALQSAPRTRTAGIIMRINSPRQPGVMEMPMTKFIIAANTRHSAVCGSGGYVRFRWLLHRVIADKIFRTRPAWWAPLAY
jgi:hypothetical protein